MDDAISRQGVLKLLSTMPPEEAITKAMLIQNVKYMSAAQPEKRTEERTEKHACDCISRQAAIDAIRKGYPDAINSDYKDGLRIATDRAIYHVEQLPLVTPEQQWIPCSTRLPEKPNVYTVTDSKGDVVRFVFTGTDSSREYWKRCAKAWMPLPTPYREE